MIRTKSVSCVRNDYLQFFIAFVALEILNKLLFHEKLVYMFLKIEKTCIKT